MSLSSNFLQTNDNFTSNTIVSDKSVANWLTWLRYQFETYDNLIPQKEQISNNEESIPFELLNRITFAQIHYSSMTTFPQCHNVQLLHRAPRQFQTILSDDIGLDVIMWRNRLRFSYCEEIHSDNSDIKDVKNPNHNKQLLNELTAPSGNSSSATTQHSSSSNLNDPPSSTIPKFPSEDTIELRTTSPSVFRRTSQIRPKTIQILQSVQEEYKVKGLIKFIDKTSANHQQIELKSGQYLYFNEHSIEIKDEHCNNRTIYKTYCKFSADPPEQNYKLISKKQIELYCDLERNCFEFVFKSSKDGKLFVEWFRNRNLGKSTTATTTNNNQSRIKIAINKLLKKRNSREFLINQGIIRNETVFGNTIQILFGIKQDIPEFLIKIIQLIELPANITQQGIYRASGNMATIQKIRLRVDDGKLSILDEYRNDVDLLTGTLKMFFRELKDSLITFDVFTEILNLIDLTESGVEEQVKKVIGKLPKANFLVLWYLLQHLVNVCMYHEENKMDYHNMAIAWGPSLISFDNLESTNINTITFHSTNSHKITEYLLKNFKQIFGFYHNRQKLSNFDILTQLIDQIERHCTPMPPDGIYRKCGQRNVVDEIVQKLTQSKLDEVISCNYPIYELCDSLREFIKMEKICLPDELLNEFDDIRQRDVFDIDNDMLDKRKVGEMLWDRMRCDRNYASLNRILEHLAKLMLQICDDRGVFSVWMMVLTSNNIKESRESTTKFSHILDLLLWKLNYVHFSKRAISTYENVSDYNKTDCTKL